MDGVPGRLTKHARNGILKLGKGIAPLGEATSAGQSGTRPGGELGDSGPGRAVKASALWPAFYRPPDLRSVKPMLPAIHGLGTGRLSWACSSSLSPHSQELASVYRGTGAMSRKEVRENVDLGQAVRYRILEVLNYKDLGPTDLDRAYAYSAGYWGKILKASKALLPRHVREVASLTHTPVRWLEDGTGPPGVPAPDEVMRTDMQGVGLKYRVEMASTAEKANEESWQYCPHCGKMLNHRP